MKKQTLFSLTSGAMWCLIALRFGYHITNWQWWAIIVIGAVFTSLIYAICKD